VSNNEAGVSPIDGHLHYGDAGRAECAVCCLEAERDRLRAVVDAVLVWLREMTDTACDVDVLRVADLYRTVAGQLDVSPSMGDDVSPLRRILDEVPLDVSPNTGAKD
jgi:hypothetical protein